MAETSSGDDDAAVEWGKSEKKAGLLVEGDGKFESGEGRPRRVFEEKE